MKVVRLYLLCTLLAFFNVQYSMSRPMGDVDTDTIEKSKIAKRAPRSEYVGKIEDNFSITPMGQVDYEIPIPVVPGTGGVAPKLSIVYNSSKKIGLLGYGFDLAGLSIISRAPSNRFNDGVAGYVNFTESDHFSLDGTRLMVVDSLTNSYIYQTEANSFSKIVAYGSRIDPDSFIVKTKAGLTYKYESNTDLLGHPSETGLFWMLTKVKDTKGNYFTVTYQGNTDQGGSLLDNTIYPTRVDYTGNEASSLAPYASVRFSYATEQNPQFTYIYGKLIVHEKTMSRIDVYMGNSIEKTFRIDYEVVDQVKQISKITEIAEDGAEKNPTTFDWSLSNVSDISKTSCKSNLISNGILTIGDYNGDGMSDFIVTPKDKNARWNAKEWRLLLSENGIPAYHSAGVFKFDGDIRQVVSGDFNGDGYDDFAVLSGYNNKYTTYFYISFKRNKTTLFEKADYNYQSNNQYSIQVIENNGDGRADLIACYSKDKRYEVLLSAGKGYQVSSVGQFPSGSLGNTEYLDFNGDGLTDILLSYSNNCYLLSSNGHGGFTCLDYTTTQFSSSYTILPGDFNGDGKTDILVTSWNNHVWSEWHLCMSTGRGNFLTKTLLPLCQTTKYQLIVGDANGDGYDDIYAIKKSTDKQGKEAPMVYLNDGTGSFYFQPMSPTTDALDRCKVYTGDFNGDGKTDIVTTPDWEHTNENYFQLFLTHAQNSNLLTRITDGMGNFTDISYKYLSDNTVHHQDFDSNYPLTTFCAAWPVVSQVSTPNGIGGTDVKTYTYRNALIHKDGRGVIGFMGVNIKDETTQVVTDTEYEVNSEKFILNLKHSVTTVNGQLISESTIYNGVQDYGNDVYSCLPDSTVEQAYEYNTGTQISKVRTSYLYDGYGNPIEVTSTNGDITTITVNSYDNDAHRWYIGRLSQAVVTKKKASETKIRQAIFEYDKISGLLVGETTEPDDILGFKKEYEHDAFGNIKKSTTTPNNSRYAPRSQSTTYDAKGRFIEQETNSLGHSVSHTIDPDNGQLIESVDANDIKTEYSYDAFNRQTGSLTPIASTSTEIRWSDGVDDAPSNALYYTSTVATGEPEVLEFFDCLGRTIRTVTTNANNQRIYTDVVYNAKGQVEKTSEPYFPGETVYWNTTEYDDCGRVIKKHDAAGHTTEIDYKGFVTTTTDALGHKTTRTMDINGNLKQVKDHEGNIIDYEYDVEGHCTKVKGPRKEVRMGYDLMGNRILLDDPDLGIVENTYNAYGELVEQKDQKGITTYEYDAGGRLLKETRPDVTVTSVYDKDFKGTLSSKSSSNGIKTTFAYDKYGRVKEQTERINNRNFTTKTTYNSQNKVDKLTYPSSLVVQNIYSDNGYLKCVKNVKTEAILWQLDAQNAKGQITQESYGNGLVTTMGYNDATGWLQRISTNGIQDWTYSYDAIGDLVQRKDVAKNLTEDFVYDTLGRLVKVKKNGLPTQEMTYDEAGNILSKTGVGYDFGYIEGTNRLNSFKPYNPMPQQWDNIQYTSFHKISRISQGNDYLSLTYGPDKSRSLSVMQRSGETETKYYIGSLYEETVKGGKTKKTCYIFAGGKVVAISETSSASGTRILYLHHDHLGSVQAYSDESGNLVQELSYDAWGRRRNSTTWEYYSSDIEADALNPWGFTGHEHIDLFEMVNMDGRMYDPVLGRFLSPDPIVQAPDFTQGLNRYTYCLNNPLSLVDPTGYSWLSDNWKSLVASCVGIAVSAITAGTGTTLGIAIIAGAAGGAAGALTGALLNGSNIGQIAKATLTGAFWGGVNALFNFASADQDLLAKLFKHSFTQGWLEGAQGGNMFHGMLMGVVSGGGGHYIRQNAGTLGRLGQITANAVLSGTIEELGGGKFANGAVTGAFSIMFNDMMHSYTKRRNLRFKMFGQVPFDKNPATMANICLDLKATIIETHHPNGNVSIDGYGVMANTDGVTLDVGLEMTINFDSDTKTFNFSRQYFGPNVNQEGYHYFGEVHTGTLSVSRYKSVSVSLTPYFSYSDSGMGNAVPTLPGAFCIIPSQWMMKKNFKLK